MTIRRSIAILFGMVVAICGILSAIAIPNFLEESRSGQVSKAMAGARILATAIEDFRVDHGALPPSRSLDEWAQSQGRKSARALAKAGGTGLSTVEWKYGGITTPVAYIAIPPFDSCASVPTMPFAYLSHADGYILFSTGPDADYDIRPNPALLALDSAHAQRTLAESSLAYDPTNGTVSNGDIYRVRIERRP